ncbi:hypothetical protein [Oscillatoria sp. FACHB-1407]|nr:hypothetical protein [Oscillatoria sp. FACHB-1407]
MVNGQWSIAHSPTYPSVQECFNLRSWGVAIATQPSLKPLRS